LRFEGFEEASCVSLADLTAARWDQQGPAFEAELFSEDGGKETLARGLKSR
jgi:hypothetical protein